MKTIFSIVAILAFTLFGFSGSCQTSVSGYMKKNGTYVAPHYRSNPNHTKLDNFSTKPNLNPYTGEIGTKSATNQESKTLHSTILGGSSFSGSTLSQSNNNQSSEATQCIGITKAGNQCKRRTKNTSGYCYQH